MCGILGITTKKEYPQGSLQKMAEILLRLSESRGKEAAGFAVKRNDSIDVLKMPLGPSDFLRSSAYKEFSKNAFNGALSIIGHSRLATHGAESDNRNNQPVVKDNAVCVHNGIIANDRELWQKFPELKREYQVDTEILLSLLQRFGLKKTFEIIEGSASITVLFNNNYYLTLATNTGSLYTIENQSKDTFVFASERYILEQFVNKIKGIDLFDAGEIKQAAPGKAFAVNVKTLEKSAIENLSVALHPETKFVDYSVYFPEVNINAGVDAKLSQETKKTMEENYENLYSLYDQGKIKRCVRCLLPETMTFIDFDENGLCNYCRDHKKIEVKGEKALQEIVSEYRRSDGSPDCILGFSGGRDSSYGLHYIKKVLKMNPVAYTYDWGVLTDLGRRNQARVCGKLGVEHIIISADIRRKRANVLANLNAWLKKPTMGMIPILMAGDKKHIYCGKLLGKKMGIKLVIHSCGNGLEGAIFRIGLTGVPMTIESTAEISLAHKLRLSSYYGYQYLRNPAYFNRSLVDTFLSFYYNFFSPEHRLNLYNYIKWDEKEILSTIIKEYNWESELDTAVTWRIDDGTAVFYNYSDLTVMGFTEFDTFRSAQIRDGQIGREEAYKILKEENKPRYALIEWYAKTIGFDANKAIKTINDIPKFYFKK